jgi:hypothetical protein
MKLAIPTLPPGCPGSTIGVLAFHDRVRNGIGWFHGTIVTSKVTGLACARKHRPDQNGCERWMGVNAAAGRESCTGTNPRAPPDFTGESVPRKKPNGRFVHVC